MFDPESIKNDLVDIGHIWPKYLHQYGKQAKHQQILLCKKCNSTAGSYGDERMQVDVQINEGAKTGDLGLRNLCVTSSLRDKEALPLQAVVKK